MQHRGFSVGILALVSMMSAPLHADQRGRPAGHTPTTHGPTTHGPTTHGPTTHGPTTHGPTTHGPTTHSPTTHGPTTHGPTSKGSSPQATAAHGRGKPSSNTSTDSTGGTTTTTATASTATTSSVDFTAGPVAQRLSKNTALTAKLETRLAGLGYQGTVYEAAYGFKNLGQFVAAVNVSQNLGISFDELKLQMTGLAVSPEGTVQMANLASDGSVTLVDPAEATNPAPTESLGQAIQSVDSTVDSTSAAETATIQADADIEP